MAFLESGKFTVGCNYWASHAGTEMWSKWRPDVIEEDFKDLSQKGIKLLRVFPLLSEFQPITPGYKVCGELEEVRFGEEPLPDTAEGRMGVSEEALEKFAVLCKLAEKYGFKLLVGLVTGWMSGRLFIPTALYGKNMLTDPTAIMWETRFVRTFVKRFAGEKAIAAWDLGNECNCLGEIKHPDELYLWAAAITGAIRTCDSVRPIVSGMHGLLPEGPFKLGYQGELTDILTTHPYPLFTPYCDSAPLNTMRPEMHGTCQTIFYRGAGGKPCFVEETGILGNCIADEKTGAAFARTCMFSLWAHNCLGFVWWCAYDQDLLPQAPYDWRAEERELGLFRNDKSEKPTLKELEAFSKFLDTFEYEKLPERIVDGVCLVTRHQDFWANAFMCFTLGKQAGIDMEFAYAGQPLPKAKRYFLPGLCGDGFMYKREIGALMEQVAEGASLYISMDSGIASGFEKMTGMHVISRERVEGRDTLHMDDGSVLPVTVNYRLNLESVGAEVLATDSQGRPMMSVYNYGRGKVFLVATPVEATMARENGRVEDKPAYHKIYEKFLEVTGDTEKAARIDQANVGLTEHVLAEDKRLVILVNYTPEEKKVALSLKPGWKVARFIRGGADIPANDCAICEIVR